MPGRGYRQAVDFEVCKALGDETRFGLYQRLAASPRPLAVSELAEAAGLHVNTVRVHLDRLREAGLVEVEAVHHGKVGRPRHRYSVVADAPGTGFDPPSHVILAGLLAALAEQMGADAGAATATGRAFGVEAAKRTPERSCLHALGAELDRLGFEPASDGGANGSPARVDFLACPFRELAEAYPELVCGLHRGICEGVASGRGSITGFSALYDPDPCHVLVAVS